MPRSVGPVQPARRCWPLLAILVVCTILAVSPLYFSTPPVSERQLAPARSSSSHGISNNLEQDTRDQVRLRNPSHDDFEAVNDSFIGSSTLTNIPSRFETFVGTVVDRIGDLVLALFGFDEQDWFDFTDQGLTDDEADQLRQLGIEGISEGAGSGLSSSWSESSLYVERTQSLHPSRPSAFGPHLFDKPLRGFLYPISLYTDSPYGCSLPTSVNPVSSTSSSLEGRDEDWIALIQRGDCPFSTKVRTAQELGAKAVVFGDEDEQHGGIKGGKGLLTPWSPDDTKNIRIPSIFVSRASYLSLVKTWQDEQRIVLDQEPQAHHSGQLHVGLEIVLSKDDMFAWPFLDLLFMLLFLPSLLTLLTVFTQRVRLARAQKAERAPKSAVAKLVVFKWGEPSPEKASGAVESSTDPSATVASSSNRVDRDEEREIGLLQPTHPTTTDEVETVTESSTLLPQSRPVIAASNSLLGRLRSFLRRPLLRRSRSSSSSSSSSLLSPLSSSSSLPIRGASLKYPSLVDCSICLDAFVANESIVIELPCSHLFHRECAMSWLLTRKGVCPICRKPVMDDDSIQDPVVPTGLAADQ
ncbi:uncharacterized protein JCM15063_005301 [Sporobolomyces koalae]|uniref:uncharacterized protein n=1 Tax=Sporobolomyces koalae TaxID=500713 RepID=UPI00317F1B36